MSMLSAFTARPIIELKQRDKSKVESVVTHGDRLLVGLSTGSLRVYRVNEGQDPSDKSVELLREVDKFSKYKVEQLAIVKEAGTLIALSNGFVSTYNVSSYDLFEAFPRSKGATAFAVTSNIVKDQGIPLIVSRLAVAVKRKLLLWTWQDSDLINEDHEIVLSSGIKTLTWATASKLVIGLTSSYVLVDVETSSVTDIVGPGSIGGGAAPDTGRFSGAGVASLGYMGMGGMVPKPLATRLGDGELLLAKDINTHFIDSDGQSLDRRQIPWAAAPEAIGYSYPFLLSLNSSKGTLEVRNPKTLTLLQSIALPNATQLYVPNPHISLAHAGKGFLVASERCIWRMDALGYDAQIDALVEQRRYDEALSLLSLLEDALLTDKEGRSKEIKIVKGQELFELKKYRMAVDLFIEAHASPERVLVLYPSVVAGDLQYLLYANTPSVASKKAEPSGVTQKSTNGVNTAPANESQDKDRNQEDSASIRSTVASILTTSRKEIDGKELQIATSELCGFLVDSRTRLQRFLSFDGTLKEKGAVTINGVDVLPSELLLPPKPENDDALEERLKITAALVDTTLFRAYMLTNPGMAGPLFRLPNFCDAGVVKDKLLESKRYNDIVDFLYGKQLHKEALDLLQALSQQEDKEDLPEQLQSSQKTIAYLQNLSQDHLDLILEYARWPLESEPTLAMDIFLADTENAESLPRDRVLSFLKSINVKLAAQYLEHVILELNDDNSEFHKELIEEYLRILKLVKGDEKVEAQAKLLEFLRTSKHYQSWKILPLLERNDPDVFEARAIILGNMGEHRQALSIYVFDMADTIKAEEYCNHVYLNNAGSASSPTLRTSTSTDEVTSSVYSDLLYLYLSPMKPHKPQVDPAIELLARHGSRLPASSTLDLIPESLTVKTLESYFTGRIRAANSIVTETRIVASLRKTLDLQEETRLRLGYPFPGGNRGRNRSVTITEDRVCGICHKRFGGSAIKVLPDSTVVHYGCSVR